MQTHLKNFPGRQNSQHKRPQGKSMVDVLKKHQKARGAETGRYRGSQRGDKG